MSMFPELTVTGHRNGHVNVDLQLGLEVGVLQEGEFVRRAHEVGHLGPKQHADQDQGGDVHW